MNRNSTIYHKVVYDLQGRKVNGLIRKGLYIKNGQKHIIK